MDSFTSEELNKIKELRSRVSDKLTSSFQNTDHYLISWLRARSMDLNKAEEMLVNSLKWRAEMGMDTILNMKLPEEFATNIPFAYLGQDPESGLPVFLYLMGRYDFKGALEKIGVQEFMRYNAYFMENIQRNILVDCSFKFGRPITKFIEIVDLDQYSYKQMMSKQCRDTVVAMQSMFDLNYPEIIHHVSMINASKLFSMLFNVLKPFVAKETLEKISVYGPDGWREEIGKKFPLELIPKHWGGLREGGDEFCSGDPIWIFGLNKDYFSDYEVVKVKARDKHVFEYKIEEENTKISWKFKSVDHDISFGILHQNNEVVPIKRVNSHKELIVGQFECTQIGTYLFVFDNSHSLTRGKYVHIRIELHSPQNDSTSARGEPSRARENRAELELEPS